MEIFGWQFKKRKDEEKIDAPFIPPQNDDAAFTIGAGYYGYNAYNINVDQTFENENDLIRRYREVALYPEVDTAINHIVNEAICGDEKSSPVEIILDDLEQSEAIKKKISEEFDTILKLLKFNNSAYEIFRKWYVDGKSYYYMIPHENTSKGLKELRYVSPLNIKKVREEKKKTGPGGISQTESVKEYYIYSPYILNTKNRQLGIKLTVDSVCHVHSGLVDETRNFIYSYLHKALKPINQLKILEDAIIIYRLSRAPERRIFYIDVGNLPRNKAEEYLKSVQSRYKNRVVYDAHTGEVKDSTNTLSMLEDYWMPRKEGGRSTEVTTLPSGQNLGEIEDIKYFQRKMLMALNVPFSRLDTEQPAAFSLGRASEISREEVNFSKFIDRLRKKFSHLFYELLKTQLILKRIISEDEWPEIAESISFNFLSDTYFAELKEAEILKERVATLREIEQYVGTYFSKEYVRKEILKMSDEDIEEMEKQLAAENEEQTPTETDSNGEVSQQSQATDTSGEKEDPWIMA